MNLTPEMIEAVGKAAVGIIAAFGAIIATLASAVAGFYSWKTRYELDKLYSAKFRPNADGTPGPMREHPAVMVKMFEASRARGAPDVDPPPAVIADDALQVPYAPGAPLPTEALAPLSPTLADKVAITVPAGQELPPVGGKGAP